MILASLILGPFVLPPPSSAQEAVTPAETSTVVVSGSPTDQPKQEASVGPYEQPAWTTQRAFGASRVYVKPPGVYEAVQFWTPEFGRDGGISHSFREEFSIGLPYRFQLDLYEDWERSADGNFRHSDVAVEMRWALANWGRIPLNPTLYGEWLFGSKRPDVYELKLLLGDVFARRWHWAANLVYEQETGGSRETEFQVSQALTYALMDQKLNIGVEMLAARVTERGSRGDPAIEFLVGPSFNFRPSSRTFVNLAPLFGVTGDSARLTVFLNFGFTFGPGAERESEVRAPTSFQAR